MDYLLFIGYLFLFAWLITKIRLFNQSGLSNTQLIILFLLKIIAGIFYGWVGIYYGYFAYMYDTWGYHNQSIIELNLLYTQPHEYFTNLFHSGYENGYGGFFASSDSYWNDLKSNIFIKLLSVFDIFSFGNYYINIIFFNFFSLAGPVMVYRVMMQVFPGKKIQVLFASFLIPSFLYWTSGIHKDGIAFLAIALLIYNVYFGLHRKKFRLSNWGAVIAGILILLTVRNYILILLIPALSAWYIAHQKPARTALVFAAVYISGAFLFFTLKYFSPALDFPKAVADKQTAFMQLEGGSGIKVRPLEPTLTGFIKNAPQALVNSTIRPFPSDIKHMLSLGVAVENFSFLLLIILYAFYKEKTTSPPTPFLWFGVFFAASLLLTIGYTVNFQGAIVRYRSIVIPLILTPLVARINWKMIRERLLNI